MRRARPDESEENQSSQVTSAPTILIVDDDTGFRLTTSEALKGAGFNVIEASSGEDALSMLEETLYPTLFYWMPSCPAWMDSKFAGKCAKGVILAIFR